VQNATIDNLEFEKVFNKGSITLRDIRIADHGTVSFRSSNLGKTDFILCDFTRAKLIFENSKLTESFFAESSFPRIVIGRGGINHNQAQLAFGQIAAAYQRQGDNVRALEYNAREVEALYRATRWKSWDILKKFNLWLNFISNNFGRYWMLGVVFSVFVGLLFFCFLLITTDKYEIGFPTIESTLVPVYLRFMNPIRFVDLESLFGAVSVKLNNWSYFWDLLGRVFLTYGYYQTIQAFRRYGRK